MKTIQDEYAKQFKMAAQSIFSDMNETVFHTLSHPNFYSSCSFCWWSRKTGIVRRMRKALRDIFENHNERCMCGTMGDCERHRPIDEKLHKVLPRFKRPAPHSWKL